MTYSELKERLTHRAPIDGQLDKYESICAKGLELAERIIVECDDGREVSLAITKIEEALLWAHAAIARH